MLISRLAKSDTSDTNWRLFGAEAAAWTDAWTAGFAPKPHFLGAAVVVVDRSEQAGSEALHF